MLGVPVGSSEYVLAQLVQKVEEHTLLLDRMALVVVLRITEGELFVTDSSTRVHRGFWQKARRERVQVSMPNTPDRKSARGCASSHIIASHVGRSGSWGCPWNCFSGTRMSVVRSGHCHTPSRSWSGSSFLGKLWQLENDLKTHQVKSGSLASQNMDGRNSRPPQCRNTTERLPCGQGWPDPKRRCCGLRVVPWLLSPSRQCQ